MKLQFEYTNHNTISTKDFFNRDGVLVFDVESKNEMKIMLEDISNKLNIADDYLIKKLEMMLKYELPFFATNRRLARDWMVDNFIF